MKDIRIQLYERFRFFIDDYEISLGAKSTEFLALLASVGGNKVNAKDTWIFLKKPFGFKYNSSIYSLYFKKLQDDLAQCDVEELLLIGHYPVRSCRIDRTVVHCDYYDVLDGKKPQKPKELFLPEYAWSQEICFHSWRALNDYWEKLHVGMPGL